MNQQPRLAIVGATGLVGRVMRRVLEERKFPFSTIKFLASPNSVGKRIEFAGKEWPVELLSAENLANLDIVLSSTPSSISREFSPIAAKAGAVVVDNSSAWRMDPETPLVVPEVNPHAIKRHRGIIANPNCSTIQMVVALKPLHDLARIKRIVVATYQASSGKGASAVAELEAQQSALSQGKSIPVAAVHKHQLADNCVADDWNIGEGDYSEEELKMMRETRKIMEDDSIGVSVTCVRVPVRVCHSEAINIEFERPVSVEEARAALSKAPGVVLLDDPRSGQTPMPTTAANRDETFVGRIRKDPSNANALNIWVVADNLRKGAATNAIQIAELLVK